jgi:hypothetical protein
MIALEHATMETECSNNKSSLGLFRVSLAGDFFVSQDY